MKPILVAGEINVDMVLRGVHGPPVPGTEIVADDFAMVLGSASAICASGLARLGNPVVFAGRVGADPWGAYCLEAMRERGIDVSAVRSDPELKTGVTVALTTGAERSLVSYLGCTGELRAGDVDDALLGRAGHLHVSSFFLQSGLRPGCRELFARARRLGLTTSLDPGFDPGRGWDGGLMETLSEVDLFFPNEVELLAIAGAGDVAGALARLDGRCARTVAKLGAAGAATMEGGELMRIPAFAVEPFDTTGAGDSFDAGFLHAWLRGAPLADCLRLGAACGALSTRGLGGTASQPLLEEAERFLAEHG